MKDISKENQDLQSHITSGIEQIVSDAIKSTLKAPKESAFLLKFAKACTKASKKREVSEAMGDHIPGFLIASITSSCNLHCAGCYSRGIESTTDNAPSCQLSAAEWQKIFEESRELGISFILLVGGEPMLRRDVITAASEINDIMFPIFTNGTYIDPDYLTLLDDHRNLVPVLSIEGDRKTTDSRRGKGVYDVVLSNMREFKARHLLFGASITVTTENIKEVTSQEYADALFDHGCKLMFFIEYVAVDDNSKHLAPKDAERKYLEETVESLRKNYPGMIFLSFPGDELAMGGCMAAGREFFHINSHGGAEPCPFSPFSDVNVKNTSLKEALNSKLFRTIRASDILLEAHTGGCVLYEKRDVIEALIDR